MISKNSMLAEPTAYEPDRVDSAKAALESGAMSAITYGEAYTYVSKVFNDDTKTLSPQEANEMFPDMEVKFDAPISLEDAEIVGKRATRQRQLDTVVANGPQDLMQKGINLVSGMAAHVVDPVNLVLSGVGEVAALKGASYLLKGKEIGRAGTIGVQLAGNVAGDLVSEYASVPLAQANNRDYTFYDATVNGFVGGTIGFGIQKGIRVGVSRLADKIQKSRAMKEAVESSLNNGVVPDLKHIDKIDDMIVNGDSGIEPNLGQATIKQEQQIDMNQPVTAEFYAPVDGVGNLEIGPRQFGEDLGEGVTLTTSARVANNVAGNQVDEVAGSVSKIRIQDAKILDVTADPAMLKKYKSSLKKKGGAEKFNEFVKSQGYDGVSDGTKVHIYPESVSKITELVNTKADTQAAATIDMEYMKQKASEFLDKKRKLGYSEEVDSYLKASADFSRGYTKALEKRSSELDSYIKTYQDMADAGVIDPEGIKMLDDLKESKIFANESLEIVQDYTNCLLASAV